MRVERHRRHVDTMQDYGLFIRNIKYPDPFCNKYLVMRGISHVAASHPYEHKPFHHHVAAAVAASSRERQTAHNKQEIYFVILILQFWFVVHVARRCGVRRCGHGVNSK